MPDLPEGFKPIAPTLPPGFTPVEEPSFFASPSFLTKSRPLGVTGSLPEFGARSDLGFVTGAKLGLNFFITPNEESRINLITKQIPGTKFKQDKFNNTIVVTPDGVESFLNAPGFSLQDFADFASETVKFTPSAKIASLGARLATRVALGSVGAGVTSVVEDVAADLQGADTGIDFVRAGLTALAGGGAELAAPAISGVIRFFKSKPNLFLKGALTAKGRDFVKRQGFDPDNISDKLAEAVTSKKVSPEADVFDFPLTKGQASEDSVQLAREQALRVRGDAAGGIVRSFDEIQAQRAKEIIEEIDAGLAKKFPVESTAQGGQVIREQVEKQSSDLLVAIDDAYNVAGEVGASLDRKGLDTLGDVGDFLIEQGFEVDETLFPAAAKSLAKLGELKGGNITLKTLNQLDTVRKVLGVNVSAARSKGDFRAASLIKKRFDQFLDDAVDNSLFDGDDAALELLKKARGLRAEFGRRFQESTRRTRSGKLIQDPGGKVVESIIERSPTDENVVNMIFGRSKLFNDNNALKAVQAIKRATNNSADVDAVLKQLALRRISATSLQGGGFNPKKFVPSFKEAMEKSPALMREIFTKDELIKLSEFRRLANKTIIPGKLFKPTSNASGQLKKAFVSLIGALGLGGQLPLLPGGLRGGAIGRQAATSLTAGLSTRRAKSAAFKAVSGVPSLLPGRPNNFIIAATIAATRPSGEQ